MREADRQRRLAAGDLAFPAGLGAKPAMRVMAGMLVAFLGALMAGFGAGLDETAHDLGVVAGAAGSDAAGGAADVGAVEIQPDALPQVGHGVLRQASIGTRDAGLHAVEAAIDAADKRILDTTDMRVGGDHGFGMHKRTTPACLPEFPRS